jgi:hypothetical protein
LTNPGDHRTLAYIKIRALAIEATKVTMEPKSKPGDLTDPRVRCSRSGLYKPPRSHYDNTSKRLVLNLDHFCPWIFNAVGYGNNRHFLGLLFWIFVGTVFGFYVSFEPCRYSMQEGFIREDRIERVAKLFTCLSSLLVSIGVGILFSWHLYLAGSAQTSIDNLVLKRRRRTNPDFSNPWDTGSLLENLRRAMLSEGTGVAWLEILLPPLWPSHGPFGPPFPNAFDLSFYT